MLSHCTNDKDRTGVIASLLQGLLEALKESIINSYSVTYTPIKDSKSVKRDIKKHGTGVIDNS